MAPNPRRSKPSRAERLASREPGLPRLRSLKHFPCGRWPAPAFFPAAARRPRALAHTAHAAPGSHPRLGWRDAARSGLPPCSAARAGCAQRYAASRRKASSARRCRLRARVALLPMSSRNIRGMRSGRMAGERPTGSGLRVEACRECEPESTGGKSNGRCVRACRGGRLE